MLQVGLLASIQFNWFDNISKCEISTPPLTDHCSVTLILTINNIKRPQNTIWKFNNNLLRNNDFCEEVKNLIVEVTSLDSSPLNKWEWFKFKVKEAAIKIGKYSSKQMRLKQKEIVTSINMLCSKAALSSEEKAQLENIKNQLDNLFLDKDLFALGLAGSRRVRKIILTYLILTNKCKRQIQFLN